ncbi:hypothetical protein KFK09_026797 [Dendrobium nobile]|uniref:Uncharacterized protein n=1 Tax=Dendrobium nobile TaxID=94219 RepID=A0A8T3A919_DENNO|nr:hypothetical protein KFK09_026797 [Dendrobium nobile]
MQDHTRATLIFFFEMEISQYPQSSSMQWALVQDSPIPSLCSKLANFKQHDLVSKEVHLALAQKKKRLAGEHFATIEF